MLVDQANDAAAAGAEGCGLRECAGAAEMGAGNQGGFEARVLPPAGGIGEIDHAVKCVLGGE